MIWMKDMSIRRKVTWVILITCTIVLLLAGGVLAAYEFFNFRQTLVRDMRVLADIGGQNTQAALVFDDEEAARKTLSTLQAEGKIISASLYSAHGQLFAEYLRPGATSGIPSLLEEEGHRFEGGSLILVRRVVLDGRRLGAIRLMASLEEIHARLLLFGGVVGVVLVGSLIAAFALASPLQRPISEPILKLAEAAKAIAENRDYGIRVPGGGPDEAGRLTDAFNNMVAQIHEQNKALEESSDRMRGVLNCATSAVVVIDSDGRILDWNARAEVMFGWSRTEAIGRDLAETIIPPPQRAAHRQGMIHFLSTGEGPVLDRLLEMSALRRDGTGFPVELKISALKSGGVKTFCGFITDLSSRKEAERAVRDSQHLLRAIIDNSTAVVYVKDLQGRYLLVNRRFEEIFVLPSDRILGRTDADIFPAEIAAAFRRVDQRVLDAGVVMEMEEMAPQTDGIHAFLSAKCPLFGPDGAAYAICGISTDITERKRSEARLQSQLARLELLNRITNAIGERLDLKSILQTVVGSLEDHLPVDFCCVCLYRPEENCLEVSTIGGRSEATARNIGMAAKTSLSIDQNGLARCVQGQLVHEPDLALSTFPFPQRLTRGGLRSLVVAPLLVERRAFGVLVAARREINSFSSSDCEFLRQVSEHAALAAHQARLYGELQQAYDDLRQTQQAVMQQERLRALGQMASGIAHDINNAISPVALYTESLLATEPSLSARAREYLGIIQHAIEDVAQTVGRMSEFYRQREPQLLLAPVQLNSLVQQVVDLSRARWSDMPQQRGIVIVLAAHLGPELPPVLGIESEIREALINLIFNAVDAMPSGGTLTVRTMHKESPPAMSRVLVEVSDTGVGMDEDTRRRCLEPFFTTKGERGTGLGLAMVYGMVQRHGAELSLESLRGSGTTVGISFAVSTVRTGPLSAVAEPTIPKGLRLLVIDDDPLVIKSLRDTLEADGHSVATAMGGQAGIEAFQSALKQRSPFSMVFTDLGMPHVDGRQVAATIKGISPSTPVILLTGWGQRIAVEGDMPPEVDRVLNKPPKLRELRETLAEFLGSPESSTEASERI